MGVELLEIGVKVRKGMIFTIRGCYRSVCRHPFLVGTLCFLIFLYRLSPFIFQLLVSASPILVCTAVLLGTLLSFGQPHIPEIEVEERTTVEVASIKARVSSEEGVVEENESYYVERFSERRWEEEEKSTDLSVGKFGEVVREDSDDTAPLIEERSPGPDGEVWEGNRELGDLGYEQKADWIEDRLNNGGIVENHFASDGKVDDEVHESDDEKSDADSFDSEKVNVDSLDSPPRSPWTRVEEREDKEEEVGEEEEEEEEEEEDEDDGSDSGSSRAESSSPDASLADIIPMLDELHPLLHEEGPRTVHVAHDGSDAASEKSRKSSTSGHESDDEFENHDDLEVADDDNEDDEDGQGDKEEQTKSAITWTEEDQKNLMDLGSSEIERNIRLENLILRRRARKMLADRNLIDLEGSDLPFNIAPISTRRQNPFDHPNDHDDNSGLPPIPGSAPSVLLQRQNPFDIPYDSSEEKPDLMGDGFQEEFRTSQSREPVFRRHESFNVGPSNFAPRRKDVKMRPYFVPEGSISEESSSSLFQRQSSELSESKLSSVPDTESNGSVTSVEDQEERKFLDEDNLPEIEVIAQKKDVDEESPSGDPELIFHHEVDAEEDVHQEPEMVSKLESVSEHVGHGSQSSEEDDDSVQSSPVEKRDVEFGEVESRTEDVSDHYVERYTRDSSSSSLSEESDRVFTVREGEELSMLEERRNDVALEPTVSSQTSVESNELNIMSTLVNDIPPREPVYDTSPRALSKNLSSSSISSDVHLQSDLVIDKRTVSSIERESEGCSREIETDMHSHFETSTDAVVHPDDVSRPIEVDISEHACTKTEFSGVDQRLIGESSSVDAGIPPHMPNPLKSSDEAPESSDRNPEQSQEKYLVPSGRDGVIEVNEPPLAGQLNADHSVGLEEIAQSPNPDADDEDDEKLNSATIFHDKAINEPSLNHPNEMQASSAPFVESQVTQISNIPEVQELDDYISSNINSLSSPERTSFPPSAIETATSYVDVQTVVEEVDEIKEIDDGLLSELDSVGDFSVNNLGSGSTEFEKHIDSVGEESLSSPHHAETSTTRDGEADSVVVTKVEDVMRSENSGDQIDICEEDEIIEVSRSEFNENNDEDSPYREKSGEVPEPEVGPAEDVGAVSLELTSVETEIMEKGAEVSNQGQADINATSEMTELEASTVEDIDLAFKQMSSNESEKPVNSETPLHITEEVQSTEDVDAVRPENSEWTFVETETVEGASGTNFGTLELEASEIEDTGPAFKQTSSDEIEKPPQAELQNYEDTVSVLPELEALALEDVDAVSEKAEISLVETEIIAGDAEVSYQGQGDTDTDTASGMTELEASTIEDINLAFKEISSMEIEKPAVLETPQAELNIISEKPELEVQSRGNIDAVPETYSETEIVGGGEVSSLVQVGKNATSEMTELEASKIEDIDLAFTQVTSKETEKPVDPESPQAELAIGEAITESFEDSALHKDSGVIVSTRETSIAEAEFVKDANLNQDSVDHNPAEDPISPADRVLVDETLNQPKLNSDDGSVEVKADKMGPSEEESSVKESNAVTAEKPEYEAKSSEDSHSPSSVKGKGKVSKSSSSSSSSSSESSSSDSDKE